MKELGIKHMSYNHLKEELKITYLHKEPKIIHMTLEEYQKLLEKGNFIDYV